MKRVFLHPNRREHGYTAVEVIMAMTLFAIGGAGVIAMEKASIQGELDARRQDVGVIVAKEWTERFKRDATLWGARKVASDPTSRALIADTKFLKLVPPTVDPPTTWLAPPAVSTPAGDSPAFDVLGREVGSAAKADAFYCVRYRTQVLQTRDALGTPSQIRIEVRAYWPRNGSPPGVDGYCGDADSSFTDATTALNYRFVQMTTVLVENAP